MSQTRKEPVIGPTAAVAMGLTRLGTVYLYEIGPPDLEAYANAPATSARGRLRWLLPRIAGKGPSGESRLTEQEIASLDEEEVEALIETYLASPGNQRDAADAGKGLIPTVRGGGESAVSFLDRLVRWRIQALRNTGGVAPTDVRGEPAAAARAGPVRDAPRLLSWILAAMFLALATSAFSAWLAWQAAQHAAEERTARERWQADMKALLEWNAATQDKAVRELNEEVSKLRRRLESPETHAPKAAARGSAPSKATPAKPSQARRESQPRR